VAKHKNNFRPKRYYKDLCSDLVLAYNSLLNLIKEHPNMLVEEYKSEIKFGTFTKILSRDNNKFICYETPKINDDIFPTLK
jgi:hypothetical protein